MFMIFVGRHIRDPLDDGRDGEDIYGDIVNKMLKNEQK